MEHLLSALPERTVALDSACHLAVTEGAVLQICACWGPTEATTLAARVDYDPY